MIITTTCPFCGKNQLIQVRSKDFHDWENGLPAQEAFPYLSEDDREAFISGICPDCWDETFGDEEKGYDCEPDFDDEPDYDLDMGFDPYLGCYSDDC